MLLSCKRPLTTEELLEPLFKRSRHDVLMGPEEHALVAAQEAAGCDADFVEAAAAAAVEEAEYRRMPDDVQDQPALKRLRGMIEGPSTAAAPSSEGMSKEALVRHWAEDVVKSLHGCPSVEQAVQRCSAALTDFESQVRSATMREAEQLREEMRANSVEEATCSRLQHTNKVLLKAVHHLAGRCRKLEGSSSEVQSLRQALEQSQETQRRLQHSNQVLQEHLKVHLNACHLA
ncbi:Pxmp2 [Symbiodinium natans]|uniref:Pxmp2 protein n=1 Tax=Symbiodinium natans TaxID=878477 RepID=A0A812QWC1_9DINO|nr:Pxmp2 [Symbiodinium natans]